jgi:hypothetical protein
MKLVATHIIAGDLKQISGIDQDIRQAIASVVWPSNGNNFKINPTKKANGTKPIQSNFRTTLLNKPDWTEQGEPAFDYLYTCPHSKQQFAIEWETGNIASAFRSKERIDIEKRKNPLFSGGALIISSRALGKYLTDRTGCFEELESFDLIEHMKASYQQLSWWQGGIFVIYVVEHDQEDSTVELIPKTKYNYK